MTEIKKSLASDSATLMATVAATLNFTRRVKHVELRLEGSILREHTASLREFLQNLSYFHGTKWTLELENLDVISMRALKVLVKFAQVIRRRGYEVEVTSIQPSMLATFLDLGVHESFSWQTVTRQAQPAEAAPLRHLSEMAYEGEVFADDEL